MASEGGVQDVVKAAEEIAAALAATDPADNQALAVNVHAKLEKLRDGSSDAAVQNGANECITIIEKIIFQEISPADGKKQVAEALSALIRKCSGGGAAGGGDSMQEVIEIVEDISASLILVDPTDNQALAVGIHSKLEKLRGASEDANVQAAASECVAMVEKIIFQEIKPEEGIAKIAERLTTLRRGFQYVEGASVPLEEGGAGASGGGDLAKDLDFDMDADEGDSTPKTAAAPLKQDADGFFVDTSAKAKPEVKFRREIDVSTLDASLLTEFIAEAQEHFANADAALLRLEVTPADVDIINELFRVFHTIKGVAGFLSLDAIQALAHATESLMDKAREKVFVLNSAAIDLIFSTVDTLKKEVESLTLALENNTQYVVQEIMDQIIASVHAMNESLLNNKPMPKLGEILVKEGKVSPEEVESVLHEQERRPGTKMGEILVERGAVGPNDISQALEKQGAPVNKGVVVIKESVKVDTDKLDKLVDMIGELVITESMVTGGLAGKDLQSTRLGVNARQLTKITRQLQEIGLSMRMMSLKATFNKMARLVRDLARKADKEIAFVSEGEDTELDKSVIEHISDPLVHMIRNSADHGLEHPDEREAVGKSRTGTITLRAYQKGGSICVEVQDDGKGLDRDAIFKKAVEKGLLAPDAQLSDAEIHHMIFAPGFSTAAQVTDISGRGVGMDVVKKNVESLRGRIEINTKPGQGTTFVIHLPLTLAIMDGMIVCAGDERYILPTFSVVENFKPAKTDLTDVMGTQKMVMCHGQLLPLYSLAEVMGKKNTISIDNGIVMVVEDAGKRTGLLVDKIIGQQQTVIKKLGEGVGKIDGVSGGAIMPDGKVSLIIDVAETVKLAMRSGSTIEDPEN
ncbi:MAG: chemotaxis protein CheA [Chitinispirillales bacterium]|jgi:two-component system chemotaxis sensor kinase CheA|nr:chemotaxis protein CheA [Chitinispirillales bacterium]